MILGGKVQGYWKDTSQEWKSTETRGGNPAGCLFCCVRWSVSRVFTCYVKLMLLGVGKIYKRERFLIRLLFPSEDEPRGLKVLVELWVLVVLYFNVFRESCGTHLSRLHLPLLNTVLVLSTYFTLISKIQW